MDARASRSTSCRRLSRRLLCAAILGAVLACAPAATAAAEEPPPSASAGSGENLSIGTSWGLYEQWGSEVQDSIGIVGAPMPFVMGLMDSGENRLFIFIQHRLPGGPYCAETPAQLEDVAAELTATTGDPTIPGPEYSKTYVWTPTEAGEYAFCAYLDAAPTDHPAAINFLKLTADPAPGLLSFAIASEAEEPQRSTVTVEGTAVVPSEVITSIQEQGLACTLPEGQLAGQQLSASSSSTLTGSNPGWVGPGPFTTSYTLAGEKPGAYEVCAYLTPAPTEDMYSGRPYEVGSADFYIQEAFTPPGYDRHVFIPAARRAWQPPTLRAVSMSNIRFRVASGREHSAHHTPAGTAFRFALSAPATVTVAITRLLTGVARGHSCSLLGAAAAPTPRCRRSVAVGSIIRPIAAGGADVIAFSGVVGHRKLLPGSYSAAITAHNADGSSNSISLRFTVAPTGGTS